MLIKKFSSRLFRCMPFMYLTWSSRKYKRQAICCRKYNSIEDRIAYVKKQSQFYRFFSYTVVRHRHTSWWAIKQQYLYNSDQSPSFIFHVYVSVKYNNISMIMKVFCVCGRLSIIGYVGCCLVKYTSQPQPKHEEN